MKHDIELTLCQVWVENLKEQRLGKLKVVGFSVWQGLAAGKKIPCKMKQGCVLGKQAQESGEQCGIADDVRYALDGLAAGPRACRDGAVALAEVAATRRGRLVLRCAVLSHHVKVVRKVSS